MKKVRWDTLPTATTTKKGLMSTRAYAGYAGNTASIGLTSYLAGFLIKTDIAIPPVGSMRILFSIRESNTLSSADYVTALNYSSAGVIIGNLSRSGPGLSRIEFLDDNGSLSLYVVPNNTTSYLGVVSVFAFRSTSELMNVNVNIIAGEKPSGTIILGVIEI